MAYNQMLALAAFIGVCFMVSIPGAAFRPGIWYDELRKPSWNPPKWLFAPAWTALYVMIAVSGWLVWREVGLTDAAIVPFTVYALQLLLNAAWSGLFFGLRRMDWAFAEVVALWLSIAATIAVFAPISEIAACLLLPYLAWVSFAGFLNLTLVRLNRRIG